MLEEVLLIDDDEIDNATHKRVLEKMGGFKKIITFQYADEALEYLKSDPSNNVRLIFLDINMPRMDGFEFMDKYVRLEEAQKADRIVIMLTTSSHPDDKQRANENAHIADFLRKPLTLEKLQNILTTHFAG